MINPNQWIQEDLDKYLIHYPEDANMFDLLRYQLREGHDLQDRKNMAGHVTSSMFVLNNEMTKALLIHHIAFDSWICPGGHYEGDVPVHISALRELAEETGMEQDFVGLRDGMGQFIILDVDTHSIPARPNKGEGEHFHHDFLYLTRATVPFEPSPQLEEVHAAAWKSLDELLEAPDRRVRRVTQKVVQLLKDLDA